MIPSPPETGFSAGPEATGGLGTAPLDRVAPTVRVAAGLGLSFLVAVAHRPETIGTGLAVALILAVAARLHPGHALRRLAGPWGFLAFLWIMLPLTYPGIGLGTVLVRLGPIPLSREGVVLAGAITLKATAIALMFLALVGPLDFVTLGHALGRLGLPPVLTRLLLMAFRYVFVIEEEYRRLRRAMTVRGFRPGMNRHAYQTLAWLAAMILVRASARADRVYRAMRCRGFTGAFHPLREPVSPDGGWRWAAGFTLCGVALAVMEWGRGAWHV